MRWTRCAGRVGPMPAAVVASSLEVSLARAASPTARGTRLAREFHGVVYAEALQEEFPPTISSTLLR